ncbi:hypothetical protein ABIB48_002412 [Arthrobacter sp. UYCu511]
MRGFYRRSHLCSPVLSRQLLVHGLSSCVRPVQKIYLGLEWKQERNYARHSVRKR